MHELNPPLLTKREFLTKGSLAGLGLILAACSGRRTSPPASEFPEGPEIPAHIRAMLPEQIARATEEAARPSPERSAPQLLWQSEVSSTGILQARTQTGILSPVLASENAIYFIDSQRRVLVKKGIEGSDQWAWDNPALPLAVSGDILGIFRTDHSRFYGLSTTIGQRVWRFIPENPLGSPPVIFKNKVYFINKQDNPRGSFNLIEIDIATGALDYKSNILEQRFQGPSNFANGYISFINEELIVISSGQGFFSQFMVMSQNENSTPAKQAVDNAIEIVQLSNPLAGILKAGDFIMVKKGIEGVTDPVFIFYNSSNLEQSWGLKPDKNFAQLIGSTDKLIFFKSQSGDSLSVFSIPTLETWTNNEISPARILDADDNLVLVALEQNAVAAVDIQYGKRQWRLATGRNETPLAGLILPQGFAIGAGRNLYLVDRFGQQTHIVNAKMDIQSLRLKRNYAVVRGRNNVGVIRI